MSFSGLQQLLVFTCCVGLASALDGASSTNIQQSTIDLDVIKHVPKPKERIVGGTTANAGAYPFFAQWMKGCGGSRKCCMSHTRLPILCAYLTLFR